MKFAIWQLDKDPSLFRVDLSAFRQQYWFFSIILQKCHIIHACKGQGQSFAPGSEKNIVKHEYTCFTHEDAIIKKQSSMQLI